MSMWYSKRYKRKETKAMKAWGGKFHEPEGTTTSRQRRGVKLAKSPWGYWCEVRSVVRVHLPGVVHVVPIGGTVV